VPPPSALKTLGPGCSRQAVELAVRELIREFRDPHSQSWFASVCLDVRAGRLPAEAVEGAYRRAMGPTVRKPGAAFTASVRAIEA
jgi:hypothetical protein